MDVSFQSTQSTQQQQQQMDNLHKWHQKVKHNLQYNYKYCFSNIGTIVATIYKISKKWLDIYCTVKDVLDHLY